MPGAISSEPRPSPQLPRVVIVGAGDARRLTAEPDDERAADALASRGPATVALTGGAAGSLLRTDAGFVRAPVPEVKTVDTTGAGDSFGAGIIFGVVRGMQDPMRIAALANACGAAAVGVGGAGAGLPGIDGILAAVAGLPSDLSAELIPVIARSPSRSRNPMNPLGSASMLTASSP